MTIDLGFHLSPAKATRVLPWLYCTGEAGVSKVLSEVSVWIDLREEDEGNLPIPVPEHVMVIRLPFKDGDAKMAARVIPLAKRILDDIKAQGNKAVVSCHAGISRSATVALYAMACELGYWEAWKRLNLMRPIVNPDRQFKAILDQIRQETEDSGWIKQRNQ